jgi:nucleotide-binding universal stress UspA family protein
LIHVLDPQTEVNGACQIPPAPGDQLSIAERNLQAIANSSCPSGTLYITSTVRAGFAATEIVAAAKEFNVDLIITATHGLTGWKHFGMGNTAERVSRAASCPVLIVHEKEQEFI